MSNLQHRQSIIQEKRKKTPWRNFVMEIGSWAPLMFYKNNGFISRFPVSNRTGKLIPYKEFNDYGGNFELFGIDNYSDNFFRSMTEIYRNMVFTPMFTYGGSENSDYVDRSLGAKNCYLSSTIINGVENAFYSFSIKENCSNVINSGVVWNNCNNIFDSRLIINSYSIYFSQHILDSSEIWYSDNLIGCHHCIQCSNLNNQSYCINNIKYNKEEYIKKSFPYIRKLDINYVRKYNIQTNIECLNCENVMFGYQLSDSRNCSFVGGRFPNSCMFDCMNAGGSNSGENYDYYGVLGGGNGSNNIYSCIAFLNSSNLYYSMNMTDCSFCLGCIGLKNKSYCILNKQYTKEERYIEVDKIFGQMYADGTLGEFFPATMNPFYFNDTAAYLIDPTFTKEEVTAKGYLRRDEPIKVDIPAGVQTVSVKDLDKYEGWAVGTHDNASEQKRTIDDEILKKVILDDAGNAYRIIPMELEFLRKYELPLPRKHWLDRMKENFRIS